MVSPQALVCKRRVNFGAVVRHRRADSAGQGAAVSSATLCCLLSLAMRLVGQTLRARLAAQAEEKDAQLLMIKWKQHHKALTTFFRYPLRPWFPPSLPCTSFHVISHLILFVLGSPTQPVASAHACLGPVRRVAVALRRGFPLLGLGQRGKAPEVVGCLKPHPLSPA